MKTRVLLRIIAVVAAQACSAGSNDSADDGNPEGPPDPPSGGSGSMASGTGGVRSSQGGESPQGGGSSEGATAGSLSGGARPTVTGGAGGNGSGVSPADGTFCGTSRLGSVNLLVRSGALHDYRFTISVANCEMAVFASLDGATLGADGSFEIGTVSSPRLEGRFTSPTTVTGTLELEEERPGGPTICAPGEILDWSASFTDGCCSAEYTCLDSSCIPEPLLCDSVDTCPDGDDEADCSGGGSGVGGASGTGGTGPACPEGLTPCGTTCADLVTEVINCGRCGVECPIGQLCRGGECACPFEEMTPCDDGGCYDLGANPQHCGMCGNACTPGSGCMMGECL